MHRTLALALSAAIAVAPALATAAAAATTPAGPQTIALPAGSQPEGITSGPGATFFAGARTDGAIYRGDLRTGQGAILVPGETGRVAVGMEYDESTGILWVAGGRSGAVTAYDGRTGAELARYVVPGTRFLNDLTVSRRAVYVTDSLSAELVVIPLGRRGQLPASYQLLPLTGDFALAEGNNANGIRVLPDGRLIIVQGNVGKLLTVNPANGRADQIELTGPALTGGDGLELRGNTLYVVYGFRTNEIAVVQLDGRARSGEVVGRLTDTELDRPTTATLVGGTLYVVNGRFSVPPTPTTPYSVVAVSPAEVLPERRGGQELVPLPAGSQPEGITSGLGATFYAGARTDGAISRGNLRTGRVSTLVPGQTGRVAVGMEYDEGTGILWVAGGATGSITGYDGSNGQELVRYVVPGARFLNDVTVTETAIYVTDSRAAELVVIDRSNPIGYQLLPLTGDYAQAAGFNVNGIRALPDGDLIIVQSATGKLFRVAAGTGRADEIELTGPRLTGGDGLELRGSTLYVVNGFGGNEIAVVALDDDARSGQVVGQVTDTDLDRPTTATFFGGRLYVINGRFSVPPTPTTPYDVVQVVALR